MTEQSMKVLMAVALVGALAVPLAAHHSISAEFDSTKPITFTGKVTKVEWMNPHIYFYMDVADAGGAKVHWSIEGGAPSTLYRAGWRKDSAKVGEVVTVSGFLAKDGSKLVNMQSAVLADGRNLFVGNQTYYQKGR